MSGLTLTLAPDAVLTIADAAKATGKSTDSIKRRRVAGAYPGAHPRPGDARDTWLIPVTDLVAAGDLPATALADPIGFVTNVVESHRISQLREDKAQLTERVASLTAQVSGLEQERDWLRGQLITRLGA